MSTSSTHSTRSDFDLGVRLGKGSFGEVFAAKRHKDGRTYVIKMIRIAELSQKEQRAAVNEVHVMASLSSPFVVRYFDSFIEDGLLHIVMEYCSRGDLQQLIRSETENNAPPMDETRVWAIFLQVLLGLAYLHSKRILHRDLKSANIFLALGGSIKIGDLGVARVLGTESFFAKTCVGTPYYLSPELCEDKPYNDKSDMWALGCVLYELCTRKHPFDARNQGALVLKIIQGKYPPVSSSSYSVELRTMIDLLLARDTRRRPSAADLLSSTSVSERVRALQMSALSLELSIPPTLPTSQPQTQTHMPSKLVSHNEVSITSLIIHEENKTSSSIEQIDVPIHSSTSETIQNFEADEPIVENEEDIFSKNYKDDIYENDFQRPPSPLNAEADALALAVYDKCLSTSIKLTTKSSTNDSIESKESDNNEYDLKVHEKKIIAASMSHMSPPPLPIAPAPRRSKWFDQPPLPLQSHHTDPTREDDKLRGRRPQTTSDVILSRKQQQHLIRSPLDIVSNAHIPSTAATLIREKSPVVGPYISSGMVGGGGGGEGRSLSGPRSLTAVGGSRRVRKGDPTGGIRQKKVLPLSEEAQRAASAAAAAIVPRGYARSSSSGSNSSGNNGGVVRVRTPVRTLAPTGAASFPVAPRSPSQQFQQQRNEELARLRAREEVAALPDFGVGVNSDNIHHYQHQKSSTSINSLTQVSSMHKRESSNRPSIALLKSVSNDIPTNNDNQDLDQTELVHVDDDRNHATVNNNNNKEEEEENEEEEEEYEADFDEELGENENDITQDVIAELHAERAILSDQVTALSSACKRVMPADTAARFLQELMTLPKKEEEEETNDAALERMADAEQTLSVESYLILYRLNYAQTRIREIDEQLR
jgi:serine/threonine protein kinase